MRFPVVFCLAAASLPGCSEPTPPPAPAPVLAAIRSTAGADRIHAINEAAYRHRDEPASLAVLFEDEDPQVRWAAAYVASLWSDDAADVDALAPLLNDRDESIRAVVAGSLAGLGHTGARDVLAALRSSTVPLPFSDPPQTVGRFASDALGAIEAAKTR